MIFSISNGKEEMKYELPERASDVTLGQVITFQKKVESQKPESLKKYEDLLTILNASEEGSTDHDEALTAISEFMKQTDYTVEWASFFAKEIAFWTGMPVQYAEQLPLSLAEDEEGLTIFELRAALIKGLYNYEQKKEFKSFELDGVEYRLPENPMNPLTNVIDPMRTSTLGEFIEAAAIDEALSRSDNSSAEAMLWVTAILARRENIKLPVDSEKRTRYLEAMTNKFKAIKMDTALNVAFFLDSQKGKLLNDLLSSKKIIHQPSKAKN